MKNIRAKRENGTNNSRIAYLERVGEHAEIVEDHTTSDEVGLNKTVTVYIPEDDESETYKISDQYWLVIHEESDQY